MRWLWLAGLVLAPALAAPPPLAPGYRDLPYPPPPAGSYRLADLGQATDGIVQEAGREPAALYRYLRGRRVVLSLIYTGCDDANGCPLATSVLRRLAQRIRELPRLRETVRLITLSFDPRRDTPERMASYGKGFAVEGVDWRFLTAPDEESVRALLAGYQPDALPELDEQGRASGKFSHLLRVFLIDDRQRIRNSYTASVLHPDLLLADLQTLAATGDHGAVPLPATADVLRPGDDKRGYGSAGYQTHSVAIAGRRGRAADLLAERRRAGLGLPALPVPADNPLTRDKIDLGRKLFYDRRLSLNNTVSCAMCHVPEQGFTSNEQATSVGIEGRTVRRNAPTLYNVAYQQKLFHDGRESSLENQVWGPLLAASEMGNPSVGFVVDKIRSLADYRGRFERSFGRAAGIETLGQAIASYERVLVAADAPFDRWRYGGGRDAVPPEVHRGFALFTGKAGCSRCHRVGRREALFTDNELHNTGVGFRASMAGAAPEGPVQLAPGLSVRLEAATLAAVGEGKAADLGRYEITQDPADRWKYRTPTLRNVALTAPYMHDGSVATLRAVIEFYNRGGAANENLDPAIQPLRLGDPEIADLEAFLQALTGSGVAALVADAYAAPIGDPD